MQRQHIAERLRGGCGEGVKEGWALRNGRAREMRHDPIALLEHVVRRAERCRVVGLPWIVAEEPEQNPSGTQEHQAQLLDGSIRSGRRQFRRVVGSIQWIGQRHRLLMRDLFRGSLGGSARRMPSMRKLANIYTIRASRVCSRGKLACGGAATMQKGSLSCLLR